MFQNYITLTGSVASWQAIASTLIISGLVMSNIANQTNLGIYSLTSISGKTLFLLGWILTPIIINVGYMGYLTSVVIFILTLIIENTQNQSQQIPLYITIPFVIAWLLLGYKIGSKCYSKTSSLISIIIGISSAALILVSTLILFPYQRENKIVDGVGLPLYITAWIMLTMLTSCAFIINE